MVRLAVAWWFSHEQDITVSRARIAPTTIVRVVMRQSAVVLALDVSPSVSSVDPISHAFLFEEVSFFVYGAAGQRERERGRERYSACACVFA